MITKFQKYFKDLSGKVDLHYDDYCILLGRESKFNPTVGNFSPATTIFWAYTELEGIVLHDIGNGLTIMNFENVFEERPEELANLVGDAIIYLETMYDEIGSLYDSHKMLKKTIDKLLKEVPGLKEQIEVNKYNL